METQVPTILLVVLVPLISATLCPHSHIWQLLWLYKDEVKPYAYIYIYIYIYVYPSMQHNDILFQTEVRCPPAQL